VVREGEPSRTAFGAAMLRALHQDLDSPRIFTDPLAWRILGDRDALLDGAEQWERSRLRLFIAVRHRFAEDSLATAYGRGTRQAVVLGAGFDTFAYRNPHRDLRVWEVDFPATGAWKRQRLAEAGLAAPEPVTYVGVDFETEPFLDRLVAHGLDVGAPAFFLWLGVVPYLTREATEATLRAVASVPGGEVVFDLPAPADQVPAKAQADREDLETRVAELGEPFRGGWEISEMRALLTGLGFDDVEDLGRSEIRTRYLGLGPDDRPGGAHVVRARARH
jgi:methyltransferase (TIGR00027 family)